MICSRGSPLSCNRGRSLLLQTCICAGVEYPGVLEFERLSGFGDGPLLAAVGLVPSLCLPSILVFHHQYIQAILCIWLLLASCSGVLLRFRASGISLWLRAQVIVLAGLSLGCHMRSLHCGGLVDWLCIWVEGGRVCTVGFVHLV